MTPRQQTIKRYCKQYHDRGLKPSFKQIAEAFGITTEEARKEIMAIRNDKKPFDFFDKIFR